MPPRATIVVVTYDGRRFLDDALSTLSETSFRDLRILLVDNGSADHSGAWAAERYSSIEVLRVEENQGYAFGANRGLERALEIGSAFIGLCNDDVRFDDPRWLDEGMRALEEHPNAGMIGFAEAGPERTIVPPTEPAWKPCQLVGGFAMLFRADVLRTVGLHDEVYFVYADEDDLQARMVKAGYAVLTSDCPVYHVGSGTNANFSRFSAYLQMRNGLRFCIKHGGPVAAVGRVVRILDVACSPWPLLIDRNDVSHLRMRNEGRLLVNLGLAIKAFAWNVAHLAETYRIRRAELDHIQRMQDPRSGLPAATTMAGVETKTVATHD